MSISNGSASPMPKQGCPQALGHGDGCWGTAASQERWAQLGSHPGAVPQGKTAAGQSHRLPVLGSPSAQEGGRQLSPAATTAAGPPLRPPPQQPLTPRLSPHELQVLRGSEVLLDGVVHALDKHARQVGALQQVGHGGAVPEGVHGPARPRRHACGHRDPSAPRPAWQHLP